MALTAHEQQTRQNRIHRAVSKALEQVASGNLPTLLSQVDSGLETRQRWSVISRTTPGVVYLIDLQAGCDGIETSCTCAAAEADRICYHRAMVRGAALGELPYIDGRRPLTVISPAELSGRPE